MAFRIGFDRSRLLFDDLGGRGQGAERPESSNDKSLGTFLHRGGYALGYAAATQVRSSDSMPKLWLSLPNHADASSGAWRALRDRDERPGSATYYKLVVFTAAPVMEVLLNFEQAWNEVRTETPTF